MRLACSVAGLTLPLWCPRGAWRLGLPPYPAFSFVLAPYSPDPLPQRGRGRPRLFHARGFAPCIPAPEPEAARAEPAVQESGGEGDFGFPMQGAPPPAPLLLNPGGTGQGSAPRARRGAGFSGRRIDLAAVVPKGGLGGWGCRLTLPLALFPAPYPPDPLPRRGRGRLLLYFAGGYRPRRPCF